jgi:hypothetical protein
LQLHTAPLLAARSVHSDTSKTRNQSQKTLVKGQPDSIALQLLQPVLQQAALNTGDPAHAAHSLVTRGLQKGKKTLRLSRLVTGWTCCCGPTHCHAQIIQGHGQGPHTCDAVRLRRSGHSSEQHCHTHSKPTQAAGLQPVHAHEEGNWQPNRAKRCTPCKRERQSHEQDGFACTREAHSVASLTCAPPAAEPTCRIAPAIALTVCRHVGCMIHTPC